jgi:hypothetical protein
MTRIADSSSDFNAAIIADWKRRHVAILGSETLIKSIARYVIGLIAFGALPMTIALIWLSHWL